jgi:hypothetical protein
VAEALFKFFSMKLVFCLAFAAFFCDVLADKDPFERAAGFANNMVAAGSASGNSLPAGLPPTPYQPVPPPAPYQPVSPPTPKVDFLVITTPPE